jgi:hypothetical protein
MPFSKGFDLAEALDLLALCSIVEGSTELPQPPGWTMLFDSPVIPPFTEKWQLWQDTTSAYAIVVRGTVYDPGWRWRRAASRSGLTVSTINSPPIRMRASTSVSHLARFWF